MAEFLAGAPHFVERDAAEAAIVARGARCRAQVPRADGQCTPHAPRRGTDGFFFALLERRGLVPVLGIGRELD